MDHNKLPKLSQLPKVPGHPDGSAWLWGKEDQLGRLNFLTPKRVLNSMEEVESGEVIPLNVAVKDVDPPLFGREKFNHTFTQFGDGSLLIFDERVEMNTQTASQWDGFRHFAHAKSEKLYNNCTKADIDGPNANSKCGMQNWAKHGIVGRGMLIDFASYAEKKGIVMDPFTNENITLAHLKAVAKSQGLDLRRESEGGDVRIGDIFLVRTGYGKAYMALTPAEKKEMADSFVGAIGVQKSPETMEFLHDSYFSAVVGDNPAFETWPPVGEALHEHILSLWGVALGEIWDLERLAKGCQKRKKWTFFLTSAPFNIEGGIASWANAIAIL
ncbi:hypothetical protein EDC01DRAFT_775782 [Geopyxis carbonaria]|nr:hypothetical protein EDC01DRAFT_775782 [Geopyxis carbonaria]